MRHWLLAVVSSKLREASLISAGLRQNPKDVVNVRSFSFAALFRARFAAELGPIGVGYGLTRFGVLELRNNLEAMTRPFSR